MFAYEKQIQEYVKTIDRLKKQNFGGSLFNKEIRNLESKLKTLKEQVYADLSPWERVQISRHASRPHTIDYVTKMCDEFTELCGDRTYGEDRALIGGLARIGSMRCVIIGQEKGCDTETRLDRNFGMMRPEGFRKALRLMKLAEKFNLPVVSLVDTPGAFAVLEAEERGQAWAIAQNLREMAALQVPIIVIIIGEGCSGGALGIAIGDSVAMLEHAYYAVISPESCASILYKDPTKKNLAASALKLNAENIQSLEIIDSIIKEPHGGAHQDPQAMLSSVKEYILSQWLELKSLSPETLLERRYHKFRRMGAFEYT
jgi:acetyl-CoA carboxylase carboxyl transferase subunit alpha